MEAAWNAYRKQIDHFPPHEVTQHMRDMLTPEDVIDKLIKRHEAETTRYLELKEPLGVGREHAQPWYTGPRKGDRNWPAYEAHLNRTLPKDAVLNGAIRTIDQASDKVVAMLDHPATSTFNSRGLVVGHVQSGKTSNFTAVIAKAADRGYRMFIVLSGVHNALRRQTQTRLIRDVVRLNPTLWHQITTADHDFVPTPNPASLLAGKDQSLLLVVKKNSIVLEKLKDWLASSRSHLQNCPALIIDDEADQATLATRTINPLIVEVIESLPRVCYVGYTATPFANLLADPADKTDFYPKDFILSLPRSGDYQGPETLFGRSALDGEDPNAVPGGRDMVRRIPDDEVALLRPARKADVPDFTPEVTASLRQAVLWFWTATAIRRVRSGTVDHSSMLVHAHTDTRVHDSYREPLTSLRDEAETLLSTSDERFLAELRQLWDDESTRVDATALGERSVDFDSIVALLPQVVADTQVIMDHYRSTDRLDYEAGPATVIAVGGNTLSRGLTLEGLVVSVFVRSSDVYDTLLQMGRWFGYRPDYTDLPRIYMPAQVIRWFTHLATVEAEMRLEIDRLLEEHKSPTELAVRIRCHPQMRITAPSKGRTKVRAAAAYGGALVESRYFPAAPDTTARKWHRDNAAAVEALLDAAANGATADESMPDGRILWRGLSGADVIDFVEKYRFHERSTNANSRLMRDYIQKRMEDGGLVSWNVGVVGTASANGQPQVGLKGDRSIGYVTRTRLGINGDDDVADIKTLTGSRDEGLDLTIDPKTVMNRTRLQTVRLEQQPETGLILLYPINASSKATREDRADLNVPGDLVWGAAIVFPKPSGGRDVAVEYDYVAADLSRIFPGATDEEQDDDASVLQENLDSDASGAPS
ncbi:Z1 domain-containing protein [Actinoplanes awajinensis]|nr:Z1 domain-containing protein [Actinoplanes awajinensis]